MDAASKDLRLQPGRDGGVLMQRMVWRHGLTDDEIEAAENNQCDAICKPDFHKHPDGSIVCFGCERMVTLVPPNMR